MPQSPTNKEVLAALSKFVESRGWGQFHSAENLAKSIAIEAGELLECFQWSAPTETESVKSELADVLTYCFLLAERLGELPENLILTKLVVTEAKYPVELSKGRSTKYDRL